MTRAMTIIALTCFLVVGAAATSILNQDSVPMPSAVAVAEAPARPVSNKEGKKDRLAVVAFTLAAYEPPPQQTPAQAQLQAQAQAAIPDLTSSLRQAYASTEPADVGMPAPNDPAPTSQPQAEPPQAAQPAAPVKPRAAAKPPAPKPYALLSDSQIAGIKERLKLSSSQEYYWPAVETALRAVARKIHQKRQADPNATGMPIDPDWDEVQQLKSAAMPLLFQLREDQKNEVRQLARVIGLERVAAMI